MLLLPMSCSYMCGEMQSPHRYAGIEGLSLLSALFYFLLHHLLFFTTNLHHHLSIPPHFESGSWQPECDQSQWISRFDYEVHRAS